MASLPVNPPSWSHLILAVIAFVGGLGTHSLTTPVPPVPPTPAPIIIDAVPAPIVVPDSTPKIDPVVVPPHIVIPPTPIDKQPLPPPLGGLPIAAITVKDAEEHIVSTASPGQQLTFSSENAVYGKEKSSLIWYISPKMQETIVDGGSRIIVTLPADFTKLHVQQIVGLGDQVATSTVTIESTGSKPIPIVTIDPSPSPSPVPSPVNVIPIPSSQLYIGIVDDIDNRPPAVAKLMKNEPLWEKYRKAGNKVYVWKAGANPSTEVTAKADITAIAGAKLPTGSSGIVIRNKNHDIVYLGVLPPDAEAVDALLKPFTGVN